MSTDTLLSVITVCYNAEDSIQKTVRSVLRQTYKEFEYVIVDGCSTDRTVDLIKQEIGNTDKIVRLESEPDEGIYDAMNKGARIANGQYVIYMNAGDSFCERDTLAIIARNVRPEDDVIFGDHYAVLGGKRRLHPSIHKNSIGRFLFCHQASATRRQLLLHTPFNTKYKILADSDFFDKQYLEKKVFHYIPYPLAYFNLDGVSTKRIAEKEQEQNEINEGSKSVFRHVKRAIRNRVSKFLPIWIRTMRYENYDETWLL